jgi:hypothetical protein
MTQPFDFDPIRSYLDHEYTQVAERLIPNKEFMALMQFLQPDWTPRQIIKSLKSFDSIKSFQSGFIHRAIRNLVKRNDIKLSFSGFEKLNPAKSYLFISNHRDIILDSAFLNILLFEHQHNTTEIAVGNNLLLKPWIEDLVKLNKSFVVHRDVSPRQLYEYSQRLSAYMRQSILQRQTSVWIAQREGRTKDGNDQTQVSLLKMLSISGDDKNLPGNLGELHIVPVSISYEFDPCDTLKVEEQYKKMMNPNYKKSTQDDLRSMVMGITSQRGGIHIAIGDEISEDLVKLSDLGQKNEYFKKVAELIDDQIRTNFKLWPTNYIAFDVLSGTSDNVEKYSEEERLNFEAYLENVLLPLEAHRAEIQNMFLKIYANPVSNFLAVQQR